MTRIMDIRLTRGINLGGSRRLELFLEMFNVPNFVDLTGGNNTMNAAPFLVRTAARQHRVLDHGSPPWDSGPVVAGFRGDDHRFRLETKERRKGVNCGCAFIPPREAGRVASVASRVGC